MSEMPPEMMTLCPSCMGEKVNYDILESDECPECEGAGNHEEVACPECEGAGCPLCQDEGRLYNVTCPECDGLGSLEYHPTCTECRGTGWTPHPDFMETN